MPRPAPAVNRAMDAQVALHSLRRSCAPVWAAALASGDWSVMADAKALDSTLRVAFAQLRRLTGQLEAIECPDGHARGSHGRAS